MSPLPSPARRCASAHTWNQLNGERQFDAGYEFLGCVAGSRNVSESRIFGTEAEGHAWLLSILADPGPLPDPWPGYRVEYDDHVGGTVNRSVVRSSYTDETNTVVFVRGVTSDATKNKAVTWTPGNIREVRAADGTTLWTRKAK